MLEKIMLKKCVRTISSISVAVSCIFLSGCASNSIQSTPEYQNPPVAVKEKMKSVMPSFEPWLVEVEQKFGLIGEPLSDADVDWARRLGIRNINNIRIYRTEFFPMPQDGELLSDLELLGWGSPHEDARNMGYTIFMRPETDTPKTRSEQLALIYIMENMGRSRFLYRNLIEQRSLELKDRPIWIEAQKLSKCAVIDGKIGFGCTVFGTKPINHKQMEKDRQVAEKARKEAEKAQKEEDKKQEKIRKEFSEIQKDNLMLKELENEGKNSKTQK
jgi:hypothetical protein